MGYSCCTQSLGSSAQRGKPLKMALKWELQSGFVCLVVVNLHLLVVHTSPNVGHRPSRGEVIESG